MGQHAKGCWYVHHASPVYPQPAYDCCVAALSGFLLVIVICMEVTKKKPKPMPPPPEIVAIDGESLQYTT